MDRELIDRDPPHRREIGGVHRSEPRRERAGMDELDRVPAQVKERRHRAHAQDLRQARERLGQPLRHPLIPIEPRHLFVRRPTPRTLQPRLREDEPYVAAHEWKIPHAALGDVVHRLHRTPTATATLHRLGGRGECDDEPLRRQPKRIGLERLLRRPLDDLEAVPPANALHQRAKVVARHSSLRVATACGDFRRLSPQIPNIPGRTQYCLGSATDSPTRSLGGDGAATAELRPSTSKLPPTRFCYRDESVHRVKTLIYTARASGERQSPAKSVAQRGQLVANRGRRQLTSRGTRDALSIRRLANRRRSRRGGSAHFRWTGPSYFDVTTIDRVLFAGFESVCGDVNAMLAELTTCCAVPGAVTVSAIVEL